MSETSSTTEKTFSSLNQKLGKELCRLHKNVEQLCSCEERLGYTDSRESEPKPDNKDVPSNSRHFDVFDNHIATLSRLNSELEYLLKNLEQMV